MQQSYFYDLIDFLIPKLKGKEIFTSWLNGESSDFVRLNQGNIRQPGHVHQYGLSITLIDENRHASGEICLSGNEALDKDRITQLLPALRHKIPYLPQDPHLLYSTEISNSELITPNKLPQATHAIEEIVGLGSGLDMVGLYAQGTIERGFANSLGQRNWFSRSSFNFDWSLHSHADKAVKCSYAGLEWNQQKLESKFEEGRKQLPLLQRPPKTIKPGGYRVYLSPSAVHEIVGLLSWSSFSRKATQTRQTPLLKLIEGEQQLDSRINLVENTVGGISPGFESSGFIKNDSVTLINSGQFASPLTSPRSAKEYSCSTDGANESESPQSIQLGAGSIDSNQVLRELGTGLYISNLWYLNFSDHASCRMTGMTRFATLWVENGEIVAPLNVMRFDESLYRIFGKNLVNLSKDREFILDADTYFRRSTNSALLPGILVDDFSLTL